MVKEGYKEVRIGPKEYKFPLDWEIKFFDEITNKITDGTHSTPNYVSEGIPFLSTQNIVPFRDFDFDDYEKYISKEEHKKLKKRCNPKKGDILISKCGTIGRSKLVTKEMEFNIFVGLALLKLNKSIRGDFIEQYLNYESMRKILELNAPGSTRKTLTIKSIKNLRIPLPPLPEQEKIASILSSVDKSIEKNDEVIEETKELKKGLMQQLLTKGIGHSEFKEVRIGPKKVKIPKKWEIKPLNDIKKRIYAGGTPSRSNDKYFTDGEIPWVKSGELNQNFIYNIEEKITKEALENSSAKLVPKNNVLVAMYGATAGQVGYLKQDATTNQAVLAIIPENKLIDSLFLYYLLSKEMTRIVKQRQQGTGQQNLSKTLIKDMNIFVPPLEEQKKIASILSSVDAKIKKEEEYKAKLERLKKGLMQKLLTGEIRVNTEMEV